MGPFTYRQLTELIGDPLEGEFREDGAGFRRRGAVADQQLVFRDLQADIAQHMRERPGDLDLLGLVFALLVSLGDQQCPFGIQGPGLFIQVPVPQAIDPGKRGGVIDDTRYSDAPAVLVESDLGKGSDGAFRKYVFCLRCHVLFSIP